MMPGIIKKSTLRNERALVSEQVSIPDTKRYLPSAIVCNLKNDFLFLSALVFVHKNETIFLHEIWAFSQFILLLQDNVEALI